MTITPPRNELRLDAHRPTTLAELVEVHDDMRSALGPNAEAMAPQARAYYLLDETRLKAAGKRGN
jgi:hypothetical protein